MLFCGVSSSVVSSCVCGFIVVCVVSSPVLWFHQGFIVVLTSFWCFLGGLGFALQALLGAKASKQWFLLQQSSCFRTKLPPQKVSGVASKACGNEPVQPLLRHEALHTNHPQGFFKTLPKPVASNTFRQHLSQSKWPLRKDLPTSSPVHNVPRACCVGRRAAIDLSGKACAATISKWERGR